jgi:hypothetical protein
MTCHCSDGGFFIFKGPFSFKFKTSDFSVLLHFIVAWSVNVATATNYVSHNRNLTGSVAPKAVTVVVASCGVPLPIVFQITFLPQAGVNW